MGLDEWELLLSRRRSLPSVSGVLSLGNTQVLTATRNRPRQSILREGEACASTLGALRSL